MANVDDVAVFLGLRIRERRLYLGFSRCDLARLCRLEAEKVRDLESGRDVLLANELPRLSRCLDVPISYFFDPTFPVDTTTPQDADRRSAGWARVGAMWEQDSIH
jgi:transcriptional regulator with XRE-family HTH domain